MRALCTTLTPRHTRHAESQKYPAPLNMSRNETVLEILVVKLMSEGNPLLLNDVPGLGNYS